MEGLSRVEGGAAQNRKWVWLLEVLPVVGRRFPVL